MTFRCDGLGYFGEARGTFVVELQVNLVATKLIHGRECGIDRFTRHFGDTLYEVVDDEGCAIRVIAFLSHDLITGRRLIRRRGCGGKEGMDQPEIETSRFLHGIYHLRIVPSAHTRQLNLNSVRADRTDDGLGHTELVHPVTDNFDRFGQILFALVVGDIVRDAVVLDFEHEGNAALEIETELETALGLLQKVIEQDRVALLHILEGLLETDLGKELREIDALSLTDLLESQEHRLRLIIGDHLAGLSHDRFKFGGISRDLRRDIIVEGSVV